jgi:hypothetical protein
VLTGVKIRAREAKERAYRVSDGEALHVTPKLARAKFKIRFGQVGNAAMKFGDGRLRESRKCCE